MKPFILINFKTYCESSGKRALSLAKKISQVKSNKYELALAPSLLMLNEICQKTKLKVFAQHADFADYGAHTGRILPTELKGIGVKGTILNHSERKVFLEKLQKTVSTCKKNHLQTVVCASTLAEVREVVKLKPDYLAYEPEELIGGNLSVTDAKPKSLHQAVELIKTQSPKTKILCGAGVHSQKDLQQALNLGAEGVLLAHAVIKARDPKKFLKEMLK